MDRRYCYNTSDIICLSDLCLSNEIVSLCDSIDVVGSQSQLIILVISGINTNMNLNWIKHYANGYIVNGEDMSYMESRLEQMVYICLEELEMNML